MTCIVGLKSPNGVYLGGDSCVSESNLVQTMIDPKVWKRGRFVFGYAGTLRTGQLIKYKFKHPPIQNREPTQYMVTGFVDKMRKVLKQSGAAREEHKEEEQDNDFLIGFNGHLFIIDSGYGVCEVADPFVAIGSGTEYALGALFATQGKSPEVRVKKALEAAAYYSDSVGPPFHIVKCK